MQRLANKKNQMAIRWTINEKKNDEEMLSYKNE